MLVAALIGFLFGFVGSMPVAGPIAVLIFGRGVEGRFRSAYAIGAGSVIAEVVYAFAAFWGFAILLTDYAWIVPVSNGVAAVLLLVLGVVFLRRPKGATAGPAPKDTRAGSFMLGFSISGLNPTLLATWAGAATTLFSTGLVDFQDTTLAYPFALGAGAGIGLWYLVLIALIRKYKERFKLETIDRVMQFFGVFLLGIGLYFVYSFVAYFVTG